MKQHTIEIEVRYYETDGQGIVHHANYCSKRRGITTPIWNAPAICW
jgi:acyl-CoA thioesterase FadM